jgi:hypothetical protein
MEVPDFACWTSDKCDVFAGDHVFSCWQASLATKTEIVGKSTERAGRKQGEETVTQTLIAVELGDHFWTSSQVGLSVKVQCQTRTFTVTYPGCGKAMKSTRR